MTDIEAILRDEIKRTLRCLVNCIGLVALAWFFSVLVASQSAGAVQSVSPHTKAEPETYRHIPKGCSNTKPREIIRLRMFKMDKDGSLIQVGIVLIPKGC